MSGRRTGLGRRAGGAVAWALLVALALPQLVAPVRSQSAAAAEGGDSPRESDRDRGGRRAARDRDGDFDEPDRKVERMGRDREAAADRRDMERDIEPDEVLALDLSADRLAAVRAMGFRVVDDRPLGRLGFRLLRLSTPGGIAPRLAVARLRQSDPEGTYDVDARYGVAGATACEGIRCDGQKMVDWPAEGCPDPVRLGMIDTAVSASSPALAGAGVVQWNSDDARAGAAPGDHGTLVATILAGNAQAGFAGLLPRATLFAADVFGRSHDGDESTNAMKIAMGLDWLLGQRPDAINVSLAGPPNAILHESVRLATARGIPVVAAAGNLGPGGPPQYPAAYPEVIAVTAVDHRGRAYARANRGDYIDIAAPGVHIWSAGVDGRGRFVDGTSFATPFVSAEVALRRRLRPGLQPSELKAELRGDPSQARASVMKTLGCAPAPP